MGGYTLGGGSNNAGSLNRVGSIRRVAQANAGNPVTGGIARSQNPWNHPAITNMHGPMYGPKPPAPVSPSPVQPANPVLGYQSPLGEAYGGNQHLYNEYGGGSAYTGVAPGVAVNPIAAAPVTPRHYANLADWLPSHPFAAGMNHVQQTDAYHRSIGWQPQVAPGATGYLGPVGGSISRVPAAPVSLHNPVAAPAVHYANIAAWLPSHPFAAHMTPADQRAAYLRSILGSL